MVCMMTPVALIKGRGAALPSISTWRVTASEISSRVGAAAPFRIAPLASSILARTRLVTQSRVYSSISVLTRLLESTLSTLGRLRSSMLRSTSRLLLIPYLTIVSRPLLITPSHRHARIKGK